MICNDHFFIITGGPAAGKTTLLAELQRRNFRVVAEVAREIIREQVAVKGNALPWGDRVLYAELMHRRSVETYEAAAAPRSREEDRASADPGSREEDRASESRDTAAEPVFFDRGIPDTLSYIALINEEITKEMATDARQFRYNKRVFILPPWPEIYATDSERKQDFGEAVRTYEQLLKTYQQYEYELIELPRTSVEERADRVMELFKSN